MESTSNLASKEPSLDILLEVNGQGKREAEPITCGLPWPQGGLIDPARLVLEDNEGSPVSFQVRILDRWPDQSIRWFLLDWQASVQGDGSYRLLLRNTVQANRLPPDTIQILQDEGRLVIDTGKARFHLRTGESFPFERILMGSEEAIDGKRTFLHVENEKGVLCPARITTLEIEERGALRTCVRLGGHLLGPDGKPFLDLNAYLHFFAGSPTVRFVLTLRNSRKADHPGGLWDLGTEGSVYIRDASLTVGMPPGNEPVDAKACSEIGGEFLPITLPLEVYQDSSGGTNWRSSNHLNRKHEVPNTFCGYRVITKNSETSGLRATPVVSLAKGNGRLAFAMPYFWQNFPKALEATEDSVTLRLFPQQYADVHEIQGGEQKTHSFFVAFGPDSVTAEPLAWCQQPLVARATPEWYCSTGALPYLTPKAGDSNTNYLRSVDAALEGEDTFLHKREVIDEYGWRHFGEVYGDHEAVFHKGPTPLVSHFNNQYDQVAGFALQFLRSGDTGWWRMMDELAAHVIDIDIYHTDQDKAAYNHGLFWHTYHYVDVDTGTHRSYPRAARVCGGGPANEHNYSTGLMLHYFLTGNPQARETAMGLAQWVIDMDDGSKSIFRWLDKGFTGLASSSRTPSYHGPGRGSGNSILALLDGHRLTGEAMFLDKAEQLIHRVLHPADDVPARNLLDAENRWFYTMTLQALGRYLDYKVEWNLLDKHYAYGRACLLHYARWMAEHEYPFLEKPEILEYPTETWAAQDMRKSEVFKFAALHAAGEERIKFLERAEFFFRSSTTTLSGMKTRTLARPVVLLLSFGYMHNFFQKHPGLSAPAPVETINNFGRPEVFVPQKVRAKKRFLVLAGAGAGAALLGLVLLAVWLWG